MPTKEELQNIIDELRITVNELKKMPLVSIIDIQEITKLAENDARAKFGTILGSYPSPDKAVILIDHYRITHNKTLDNMLQEYTSHATRMDNNWRRRNHY